MKALVKFAAAAAIARSSMLAVALMSISSLAVEQRKQSWDFEADEPGRIAKGFTNEVGEEP
jgi:hypothetical protein